ncbi:acylphosphatase [Candidatus Altiarchaeales archaeon WOR_SM1_SCG]|nr:acylphosphatase [Candidatus Altiarchaeales archaeon WOR_SM1_SCG]
MNPQAHLIISGKVQGVFYRASTRDKAIRIGVSGWVKNLPGGKVEAVFQGEKHKVEQMIEWCRKGPPGARVDDVSVTMEEPSEEFATFEVRYR